MISWTVAVRGRGGCRGRGRACDRDAGVFGRTWVRRDPRVDLDLWHEHDFEIALPLVPYTIGNTGLDNDGRMIRSADDT